MNKYIVDPFDLVFLHAIDNGLHSVPHLSFHEEKNTLKFQSKRLEINGVFDAIRFDVVKQPGNIFFIEQGVWSDVDDKSGDKYWSKRNDLKAGSYCIFSNNDLATVFKVRHENGFGTIVQFSFFKKKLTSFGLISWNHKDVETNRMVLDSRSLDDRPEKNGYQLHFPFVLAVDLLSYCFTREIKELGYNESDSVESAFGIVEVSNMSQLSISVVK